MSGATLRLSGRTYGAAIEGSAVPTEEHWPEPTLRHVGRGTQYRYDNLTAEQYDQIVSHIQDVATSLMGSSDADAQTDHRAIMLDIRRSQR